jgi:hypothetical protein
MAVWECCVIERHSSLLRHAVEVSPFSLAFGGYWTAALLLRTADLGMGVCCSDDDGLILPALQLDGESQVEHLMGPRRTLCLSLSTSGQECRAPAFVETWRTVPRFAGDDSVVQPQLKCHSNWRAAWVQHQQTTEEEESQWVRGKGSQSVGLEVEAMLEAMEARIVEGQSALVRRLDTERRS